MPTRKRSAIWGFFEYIDHRTSRCAVCGNVFSHVTMTNLRKHLDRKHPEYSLDNPILPMKFSDKDDYQDDEELSKSSNFQEEDLGADDDFALDESNMNTMTKNEIIIEEIVKEIKPSASASTKYKIKKDPLSFNSYRRSEDSEPYSKRDKNGQRHAEENEFDVFGRMVSIQLKKFPLECALNVQNEIQNLITKKRLEIISKESTSTQTTQYLEQQYLLMNSN